MFDLTNPIYHDADKAREYLESLLWPNGPVCPRCGERERVTRLTGKSARPGLVRCNSCRRSFTVTVKTIFEDSKIPLHKWLLGFRLMAASKKGISAHQLHRSLHVTYKTAWFMAHRIREAMKSNDPRQFGDDGGMVEVDETFIGRDPTREVKHGGFHHKMKVLSLLDRSRGQIRSLVVDRLKAPDLAPIMFHNIAPEARLMTDEAGHYYAFRNSFAEHITVNHARLEYVRGKAHTNTIEGAFSIFKRMIKGTYQKTSKHHLHRYLAEFDFRYCHRIANGYDDSQRTDIALLGAAGRRLTYRRTGLVSA